jgi:hypothetical protein
MNTTPLFALFNNAASSVLIFEKRIVFIVSFTKSSSLPSRPHSCSISVMRHLYTSSTPCACKASLSSAWKAERRVMSSS